MLKQSPVRYERVIEHCKEVIEVEPKNVKALYRIGLAHHHLRDNDMAKKALMQASSLSKNKGNVNKVFRFIISITVILLLILV